MNIEVAYLPILTNFLQEVQANAKAFADIEILIDAMCEGKIASDCGTILTPIGKPKTGIGIEYLLLRFYMDGTFEDRSSLYLKTHYQDIKHNKLEDILSFIKNKMQDKAILFYRVNHCGKECLEARYLPATISYN